MEETPKTPAVEEEAIDMPSRSAVHADKEEEAPETPETPEADEAEKAEEAEEAPADAE